MFAKARAGVFASMLFLVAACGGGGSGSRSDSSTPPPAGGFTAAPSPTADDATSASNSKLRVALRADTRELTITWTDTFASESTFTVEGRASGGTWQTLETLAASPGTGNSYQWQRVVDTSRTYRISATKTGYAVPLATDGGQTEIPVNLLTEPMSIQIDQTEPVTGTVQLSVANVVADAHTVSYLLDADFDYLGSSNTGPQFPVSWDTGRVVDGQHTVTAMVAQTSGAFIFVPRTIMVDNPGLRVALTVNRGGMMTPNLMIHAHVTSEFAVQMVEFFVNDASLHTATTPDYSDEMGPVYEYEELNESQLPSGSNIFKAVVTDINGSTAEAIREWVVDRAPTITLTSPADGAIISNNLHVEGSFADDLTTATLRVAFGDTLILESSTAGAFSVDHSLTGLPPGEYTLNLGARDAAGKSQSVSRRIIIPPSDLTYQLVASEVAQLLAVDQGSTLYKKTNGSYVVRSAAGVETTLQVPALSTPNRWQLSNGRAVMHVRTLSPFAGHVYAFAPDGQVTNISAATGATENLNPVLKGAWVAWYSGTPAVYRIYNLITDDMLTVSMPAGTDQLPTEGFDLITTPGSEKLLFTARTGGTAPGYLYDVFSYDVQTQTTTALTGGDGYYHDILTDNTRVAWLKGFQPGPFDLASAPTSNPTATTLLPGTVASYTLRDGMLAWYVGTHLRAHDGTATRDLASAGVLCSVGDGRVLFREDSRLMLSPTAGGKQTLLYNVPLYALHDDDSAFITTGSSESMLLYRLTLP